MERLWRGQVEEAELFDVLDDPNADGWSRFHALTGLALVHGDDLRAVRALRSAWASATKRQDVLRLVCLSGLVTRAGDDAQPELEEALRSSVRELRACALNGLAFIGDTSHYAEMLALFQRALTRRQKGAGGFQLDDLTVYLLACVNRGVSDFDELKALLRQTWARIPFGRDGTPSWPIERLLPGIEDEAIPLSEIPLPRLPPLPLNRFERPARN